MDFEKLAEERHSVRSFDPRPVEKDKINLILKAGRIAPTACNKQPQRILVISDSEGMEKLAKCTRYTFNAPMALLVCYDSTKAWVRPVDGDNSGLVDASIATTQMILQAADIGLGTTWVGDFEPGLVEGEFDLPDEYVPVAIIPLGYPSRDSQKNPLHFHKHPEEKIVFYEGFGDDTR